MSRFEQILTSIEMFGFKATNFTHKAVVGGLFIGSTYDFYTILRDYTAYLKREKIPATRITSISGIKPSER